MLQLAAKSGIFGVVIVDVSREKKLQTFPIRISGYLMNPVGYAKHCMPFIHLKPGT